MSQPIVFTDSVTSFVVFAESDNSVVFSESSESFVVLVEGPQGPTGPPGADGDRSYTHNQSSPSATWTIAHNLSKFPSVTIVDSAGTEMIGEIVHDSINHVTATFTTAFSGKAYLN